MTSTPLVVQCDHEVGGRGARGQIGKLHVSWEPSHAEVCTTDREIDAGHLLSDPHSETFSPLLKGILLKKNFDTFTMRLSIPNKDFSTRDSSLFLAAFPLLLLLLGGPDLVIANIKV